MPRSSHTLWRLALDICPVFVVVAYDMCRVHGFVFTAHMMLRKRLSCDTKNISRQMGKTCRGMRDVMQRLVKLGGC